jgi:hypothetical protein
MVASRQRGVESRAWRRRVLPGERGEARVAARRGPGWAGGGKGVSSARVAAPVDAAPRPPARGPK